MAVAFGLLVRPRREPAFNVLFLMIDTLRADHLGCYGYAQPTSPFIDELAAESVLFESAISAASQTVPSVLSIWTELYPTQHGNQYFVATNSFRQNVKDMAPKVPGGVELMAERFRANGFKTGAVVTNPWLRPRYGFARGFDVYHHLVSEKKRDGDRGSTSTPAGSAAVNEDALSLLRQWKNERFFLYVHYMDVHAPYEPPEPYRTRFVGNKVGRKFYLNGPLPQASAQDVDYTRSLYDAEIRALDDALRSLLAEISALGLDSSTVVVLTADHGDEFHEHGGMGHGTTLYRELTHVPLIIRLPGRGRRGKRVGTAVSLVDLGPTLADLTGTPSPAGEGLSLAGLIEGDGNGADLRDRVIFSEIGRQRSAQRGDHKLIRRLDPPAEEAYDLVEDPLEQRPLQHETDWRVDLDRDLSRFAVQMKPVAVDEPEEKLDSVTAERLRALGYTQ